MSEPVNGYTLRGADNSGACYATINPIKALEGGTAIIKVDDTVKGKVESFINLIDDFEKDRQYYEDPVLTFENSILSGCHIDLNFEQFKTFCDEAPNLYLNMALI